MTAFAKKACSTCGETKGPNAFKSQWVERDQKRVLSGSCRACINAKARARYASDPEAHRAAKIVDHAKHAERRNRERRAQRKTPEQKAREKARAYKWAYGITLEQRDEMLAAQGGVCGICKSPDPGDKRGWCTDHDHSCCPTRSRSCGKCIRGILCFGCNVLLGCAKDSESTLHNAIEYLRKTHG